jgi:glucuronate isomerase
LDRCYALLSSERTIAPIFSKVRGGRLGTAAERMVWTAFLMVFFARLDAEKGWTKQLHLGALRNVNYSAFRSLGADTGFDAVGGFPQQAKKLAEFLDLLSQENCLPRMILYNLNPADNFQFATHCRLLRQGSGGDRQIEDRPSKIQYGSAWWFLDQKQGITAQLDALSNMPACSRVSSAWSPTHALSCPIPRHEYFRRMLCDLVGQDVARGELPDDDVLLGRLM